MAFDVNYPEKWQADYLSKTDGWDLGGATPALRDIAVSRRFEPGRMIVLGAGRGHDAREFARHGFRVTAVDFSEYAASEMRRLAHDKAPVEIMQHDLFSLPRSLDGSFDYVLEYTCFCAIDPKRRPEYADVVQRLLKPGGIYIDLAFPLDGRTGGPPFAVSAEELLGLFEDRGFVIKSRERPAKSVRRRAAAEELFIFQKRRGTTA